jgi:hypothetical protein
MLQASQLVRAQPVPEPPAREGSVLEPPAAQTARVQVRAALVAPAVRAVLARVRAVQWQPQPASMSMATRGQEGRAVLP